jgi:hypothetical protein
MAEERIIREEAKQFFRLKISSGILREQPVDIFRALKHRLDDFYSSAYKAIFLDEIEQRLKEEIVNHVQKSHNGIPSPDCTYETNANKLSFYINQEINTFPKIAHQRNIIHPQHTRSQVFVSYSRLDREALHDVKRHFKPFLNQIKFWDDTEILPGQNWKEEIKRAIDETKVAILLVSTDFLGSEFISSNELPPLLGAAEEDGAVILTIILKPCLFESFPKLNQYQAMNPPSKPVSRMTVDEKEELFVNLVRQTKRILDDKSN